MIKANHRVAIYLRVSTLEQTTANQDASSGRSPPEWGAR